LRALVISVLVVSGMVPCRADESSKAAKVEEFLRRAKVDEMLRQGMDLTMRQLKSGMIEQMLGAKIPPQLAKSFAAFHATIGAVITGALAWEKLKPKYVKLYLDAYSEEELDDFLAFYRSKSGQQMIAKTPELMTRASEIVQGHLAAVLPEIQKMFQEHMAETM